MTSIRLHGIAEDSIVDGPGLRLAVFVQGCSRNCDGCHNPDSQPYEGGTVWSVDDVLAKVTPITQGITLTGGEPFDQPRACWELACKAHRAGLDVWAYSGYTFEEICEDYEAYYNTLLEVDVLVDGPFVKNLKSHALKWRGSSNQRVIDVQASLSKGEVVLWEEE